MPDKEKPSVDDKMSFEKSLEKLDRIVEELEGGDLTLEDALRKYEEGVRLSRACQERLSQAEKKIEVLTRSLDGTLGKKDFDPEQTEAETGAAKPKKKKAPQADDDEDLLI